MGAGSRGSTNASTTPISDENNIQTFGHYNHDGTLKSEQEQSQVDDFYFATNWFTNKENSNYDEWANEIDAANRRLDWDDMDDPTKSEEGALGGYIGEDYDEINKQLADTKFSDLDPDMKAQIKLLDSAISRFELKKPIQVTRVCSSKLFGDADMTLEELQQCVGHIVQSNGYLSSGADATGTKTSGYHNVTLSIDVPAGTGHCAYIDRFNAGDSEREVLFGRNGQFHVDSVTQDAESLRFGSPNFTVHITYVGKGKQQLFK